MAGSAAAGLVLAERYRLEACLAEGSQGSLWRGVDLLAAEAPVVLRQVPPGGRQEQLRALGSRLQALLHPQVPRFGALISLGDDLWLVRDWQGGRTYAELLAARAERQLVFSAGEVLLLLRQLLPVLVVLHNQELLHGDLTPTNLLRRDRDGLPVLLDFGLVQDLSPGSLQASDRLEGCTPGYAPPEALGEPPAAWMDLHALGVTALVLLSGDGPEALLDPLTMEWRWPANLDLASGFGTFVVGLLSRDPARRHPSAAVALQHCLELPMPDATGPVPRADRTVLLVPPEPDSPPLRSGEAVASTPSPSSAAEHSQPQVSRSRQRLTDRVLRRRQQEEEVEAGLAPVLVALAVSALVGTSLGGWWLTRGTAPSAPVVESNAVGTLPAAEVDQRQQLLSRLRALQIDRAWFLKLIDASLLAQYPERNGRLPGDSRADAPLRRIWNELAEEWLARVEPLPLVMRQRLGSLSMADWDGRKSRLSAQGLSDVVLRQLVSASARNLLPGRSGQDLPPEPLRQIWLAAAVTSLESLRIETITASPQQARVVSAEVPAGGARLFAIRLPAGHSLALGVNGSPLMQMTVFGADGRVLETRGPLRVVRLPWLSSPQVQLLVGNEGVAPSMITLSLRADPPPVSPPEPPAQGTVPPVTSGAAPVPEGANSPSPDGSHNPAVQ
ncbi:MAG: serine/threonine protein kinase [Cyanobacteriota bacterium]